LLEAYASAAVLCGASLAVGEAILSLCGQRGFTCLAGPVGMAAIVVASGIAIDLPGHATTVALTLAVLVVASLIILSLRRRTPGAHPANIRSGIARTVRGMDAERSTGTHPAASSLPVTACLAALIALLFASIPFIANGRVGILGVGLVNDDMANHLLIADWLGSRAGETPVLIDQGYPVGPHALVAGLSEALGGGLIEAFAGLTLAIPVLTALVALEALAGLRPLARTIVAALVALPYLAAAYLAQEAFKEPLEALFVLAFALLLPSARSAARAVPLGALAAGAVYTYSFPGLFWLAGTAAIYAIVAAMTGVPGAHPASIHSRIARAVRGRGAERSQAAHPAALFCATAGVVLILTLPEWGRLIDFTDFRAFKSSTISGGLGNLRHQLSPLEALGIWPASDFRLSASAASGPAAAFYLGALIAAVAFLVGLPRWIRRQGPAVPAALAAAVLIYLGALAFGTVYTSAKALAIASPLVVLIGLGGLLGQASAGVRAGDASERGEPEIGRKVRAGGVLGGQPPNVRSTITRTVRGRDAERSPGAHPATRLLLLRLLAAVFAAGVALSSLLVLRQAPVAPQDHAEQLAELRPLVEGRRVLFLGRDNFIAYELRGSRPFTAVRNFYDPYYVRPDLGLRDVFRKFDFDSVRPTTLRRFRLVITTRAAYASGPPSGFEAVRETDDFVLWRRSGQLEARRTLDEGPNPGAILDCDRPAERRLSRRPGSATVYRAPPVLGGRWTPSSTVKSGAPVVQTLTVPRGRWQISIQYDATRPLEVAAPGLAQTLPANLDYRGSVPYYPVGELTRRRRGQVRFSATVERPPLGGRLLGTTSEAHLGGIAASPAGRGGPLPGEAERRVPLSAACGRYLDWWRPLRP
jgi:hypothetical protein